MGRVPRRLRVPLAGLLSLGLLATVLVLTVTGTESGGHLTANRAQLKRACGGLLPYEELRSAVPDEAPGTLDQYGTMLDPEQESRSLLNCTLSWKGHGSIHVQAVALTSHLPYEVKTDDLLAEGYEAPGITGRYANEDRDLWIVAECPKGLTGRVRPVTQMYVTAYVEETPIRTQFRTAVAVANAIAAEQGCGIKPLDLPTRVMDTYEEHFDDGKDDYEVDRIDDPGQDAEKCRWTTRSGSASLPGKWIPRGDLQESRLLDVCHAQRWNELNQELTEPQPQHMEPVDLDAASWSGELGRSAYRDYRWEGEHPGSTDDQDDTVTDDGATLALWARSTCAAGVTYHRVSVHPHFVLSASDEEPLTMTRAERAGLSRDVRKVMDSYLKAPDGWPKAQGCRDTKVLGEVEQWR
ncbi:hypothetical protein [Streptomyces flaveus]|uniref:hypothetical protein n=1 Tax=Streptomyces flaveus TaxID=66370 RepID=UPI00332D5401